MNKLIASALVVSALCSGCTGLGLMSSQGLYPQKTYTSTSPSIYTTVTSHTGAYKTPDNSLAFVETALRNNSEILEIDVNMRPNGTLVMYHDQVPNDMTGYEVDKALQMVRGTRTQINLDIKDTRVLRQLREQVMRSGMINQVFLTGIAEKDVPVVRQQFPEVRYYLNCNLDPQRYYEPRYLNEILSTLRRTGAVGINCNHLQANQTLSTWLHRNGYKLSVWTVNKRGDMKTAAGYSPDNITTRKPDKARRIVDKQKQRR